MLHLIRTSVAMLLGEELDLPEAETVRKDLLKALEALSAEARVKADDACKAPHCVSQEKQANLSSTWKELVNDNETLQVSSMSSMILKKVPVFEVNLRVPTNNAPQMPQGATA